jgi:hypothetical protein
MDIEPSVPMTTIGGQPLTQMVTINATMPYYILMCGDAADSHLQCDPGTPYPRAWR